ncbi:hypothetical protein [Paenibacillus cymbidii]|uniref:hypothetical protein n=1 Tax=Paenibacillus cymbidii TaxID=1639034 RepID=UPI0010820DD7|nr:hypothetical protein [Paenibacillus cymbidii]
MSLDDSRSEDQSLREELAKPPFAEKSVDAELKRRIGEAIDRRRSLPRRRLPLIGSAALVLIGLLVIAPRLKQETVKVPFEQAAATEQPLAAPSAAAVFEPLPALPVRSVLLLGLRTDHTEKDSRRTLGQTESSTYRTLLIAERGGKLLTAAEGGGILMPYGQQFWRIGTKTKETSTDVLHALTAAPVRGQAEAAADWPADDPNEEVKHEEKLLYVGNKYVSVGESDQVKRGNTTSRTDTVWTKEIRQLNAARSAAADEPHVSLRDIFGDSAASALAVMEGSSVLTELGMETEVNGDHWAVARKRGSWEPQVAVTQRAASSRVSSYVLADVNLKLPYSVVSYDEMDVDWKDVKAARPAAVDAMTSPDRDMIAIVTSEYIFVHPFTDNGVATDMSLRIDLNPGETMIMAQWATAKYAEDWIAQARANLR